MLPRSAPNLSDISHLPGRCKSIRYQSEGKPEYAGMEDKHENELKEKDIKKMASYMCDWIGKEGRNDLESLTWQG